jgi:hypothetical protein
MTVAPLEARTAAEAAQEETIQMDACMRLVMERFPNVQADAQQLFARDEAFRELCEEYEACNQAAVRFASSGLEQEPLRREYTALRLRLEGELLRYLQEHRGPGRE